jgi:hypothetical protein
VTHSPFTGGCQCGAVRYRFSAEPARRSVCHCRMCQKAVGNIFAPLAGGSLDTLRWTRGQPKIFRSSEIAERGFCADCGTPLTYRDLREERIFVMIACFDDPAALAPSVHVGIEGKVPWFDTLASLPATATAPDPAIVSRQHPDHDT